MLTFRNGSLHSCLISGLLPATPSAPNMPATADNPGSPFSIKTGAADYPDSFKIQLYPEIWDYSLSPGTGWDYGKHVSGETVVMDSSKYSSKESESDHDAPNRTICPELNIGKELLDRASCLAN